MATRRKNFTLYEAILTRYGSQKTFALEVLNRNESVVSRVVNNRENLEDEEQELWARLLGKTREELFGRGGA
jgi:hypothetical protein